MYIGLLGTRGLLVQKRSIYRLESQGLETVFLIIYDMIMDDRIENRYFHTYNCAENRLNFMCTIL